jgi:hypothetical protein
MTCMLITVAMQLTCALENQVVCTDNESLAQELYVPSCQVLMLDRGPRGSARETPGARSTQR